MRGSLAAVRLAIPLLILSITASVWLGYGMNPSFAAEFGGLGMITLTRRLEWVLLIGSIVPCLVLVVWVSMNRAKSWWLLGLSIVVAMLFIRYAGQSRKPIRVLESESMPTLRESGLASEDELVVGFVFEDIAYALPYRCLYRTPVVQLTDFDKRLLIIHSPHANSATVLEVSREMRAGDLEYIGMPGNSTLVYNRKYGQFIVGITGETDEGKSATGVRGRVANWTMPIWQWRRMHGESRLMVPTQADADSPGVRLRPKYLPAVEDSSMPAETPIILVHTTPKVALLMGDYDKPTQIRAGETPMVLWRDGVLLRGFKRVVDGDLYLTFRFSRDKKGREQLIDEQTRSVWNLKGRCMEGALEGKQLPEIALEENVYWGVSREWFGDLRLVRQESQEK